MTLITLISTYGSTQLLLTAAVLCAWASAPFLRYAQLLRFNYNLIGICALAISGQALIPGPSPVWRPVLRIWSNPAVIPARGPVATAQKPVPSVAPAEISARLVFIFLIGALIGAAMVGVAVLALSQWRLWRLRRGSFLLRAVGRVRVLISADVKVPFSYATPGRAYIILPAELLAHPRSLRLTVAHELQHHRQRDTLAIYALYFVKVFSFWNPLVLHWLAWIDEVQEFACDEALLQRVDAQEYARCLAEAAQTALAVSEVPVCATGFLTTQRRKLLSRRITEMFKNENNHKPNRGILAAALTAAALLLGATAYASRGWLQDRRLSLTQAQEMAHSAQKSGGFPVVVNAEVLHELNRFIGTPEGREFMRRSLKRMRSYTSLVQANIRHYGLPDELAAVPIIESGYRNLPPSSHHGAGLWMFIASTARRYGLAVNDSEDQRLNEAIETDAAMRYLANTYARFGDWPLAVMAYNVGEERLQAAMDKTGKHDAWSLIRDGLENDRGYLAQVMAAMIILKNPDSVN